MKCKKCGGFAYNDPPRHANDEASVRCAICGYREWKYATISTPIPERTEFQKAQQKYGKSPKRKETHV